MLILVTWFVLEIEKLFLNMQQKTQHQLIIKGPLTLLKAKSRGPGKLKLLIISRLCLHVVYFQMYVFK